jgi:hypothetical protein
MKSQTLGCTPSLTVISFSVLLTGGLLVRIQPEAGKCANRAGRTSRCRPPQLQIMLVASPRNHHNLQREVARFWRPLRILGRPQHRRQIPFQLDLQFAMRGAFGGQGRAERERCQARGTAGKARSRGRTAAGVAPEMGTDPRLDLRPKRSPFRSLAPADVSSRESTTRE